MKPESLKKFLSRTLPMIWVIPLLILFFVILWGFISSSMILKMVRNPVEFNPKSFGYEYESLNIVTEDGVELSGWFIPSKAGTKSVITVLHGWGANRSDVLPITIFMAKHYNLAYFDFRNHGRSGGDETSLTCLEIRDLEAVIRYLKREKKEQSENIGVFGFSMGASVALTGSSKLTEINAVIAESPFSSFNDTVARFAKLFYGIPKFIVPITLWFTAMRLGFNPEKCSPLYHISKISPRPVLIIQGGNDARMPVTEGQSLYSAAGDPKEIWIVPEADHGSIHEKSPEEYEKKILGFFQKWIKN